MLVAATWNFVSESVESDKNPSVTHVLLQDYRQVATL